jgi:hypothetical protein
MPEHDDRRPGPGTGRARPRVEERGGALVRAATALVPPVLGLRLWSRLAGPSAWLTGTVGPSLLPEVIREHPRRVADLLGETIVPLDGRRLMRERLSFLVARRLVSRALTSDRGRRYLRAHLDVQGLEHLQLACEAGKGVVLITTHFGLPFVMRIVLRRLGISHVHAKLGEQTGENIAVLGDTWARIAALRRFRTALAGGTACTLLVDGRMGAPLRLPFFRGSTDLTLGAFYLGRVTGCPIVPYFGLMPDDGSRIRVEIGPALAPVKGSGHAALVAAAEEFLGIYRAYAQRYPSHLPFRLARAGRGEFSPA